MWVAKEHENPDPDFRVEFQFLPRSGAQERLKRAFSMILRASKKPDGSDQEEAIDTQEIRDSENFQV